MNNNIYDVIVVGGGIAGINSALKLSKNKRVLLLDERNYWGGRISTKYQPQYEMGAARFSNKHKLLIKLIKRYNLTKIALPQTIDYLHDNDGNIEFVSDVHKTLDNYFQKLVAKSKVYSQSKLSSITLFEFMNMCNDEETSQQIVDMFGYFSEIKMMNAYDALNTFKEDFVNVQYYVLKEGLGYLCNHMIQEAKHYGCVCQKNSFVVDVRKNEDIFEVSTRNETYRTKNIVFAIKGGQLKQFNLLKSVHKYTDCIHNAELLRIYAKYPLRQTGVWFNNLRRMTTNSFLRQIIPINYQDGLIMVSYTDGEDIRSFKDKKDKLLKETKIKDKVHNELNRLFGGKVPQPTYFKVHYWTVGAHHWKPHCDSNKISKKMINPLKNVYICGEAFSQKQAWVEGALETSELVVSNINH
jgi:monoamine oxidase